MMRAVGVASSWVYGCFGLWKAVRVSGKERHDVCSAMASKRGKYWCQSMARDQIMEAMRYSGVASWHSP